ncbi:MAG: hypothetical protein JRE63_12800 [Deltaproteobacteria bacterium]|jgi:hypothetical protein|nr:hypothetical protein [Deltaproteobacteria bacterium]
MNFSIIKNERFQGVLLCVTFLIASFLFSFPLLQNLDWSGSGDWDYFMSLYEVPSITVFEYHQFPLWNPYSGGGISLIGNPQAGYLSPIFIINSFFGVVAGLKISVWLYTFLGMWGMWLLSGFWGMSVPARFLPPIVFMFSGVWALRIAAGHITWLSAGYIPFFFLFFLKGRTNIFWLTAAAIVQSLIFYQGGIYILIFSSIFVLIYSVVYALESKSLQILKVFASVNLLTIGLCAPKLFPSLELISHHPRSTQLGQSVPLDVFLSLFIDRYTGLERSFMGTSWWEFGCYLGIAVIALYLFSVCQFYKHKSLVISSFFLLTLSIGNFGIFSPWSSIHTLPFLNNLLVPTRALIIFCFSAALLSGIALSHLCDGSHSISRISGFIVVLFVAIDLFTVASPILRNVSTPISAPYWTELRQQGKLPDAKLYIVPPERTSQLGQSVNEFHLPFKQIRVPFDQRNIHGAWSNQYLPLLQNHGVVDAYETIPFERNALAFNDINYQGEYYFSGRGFVALEWWSPNRLVFHIKTAKKDRLVVNQNYAEGWRATQGNIISQNGLLAIDVPAGDYQLEIYYLPKTFLIGCYVFLASIILTLLFMIYSFKTSKIEFCPLHSKHHKKSGLEKHF